MDLDKISNKKRYNIIILLFCAFCGYFIKGLPVQPFHIVFLSALFYSILLLLKKGKLPTSNIFWYVILMLIYFTVTQSINQGDFNVVISIIYSLMSFIIIFLLLFDENKNLILSYAKIFINSSIVLLIFEAIYRISHPDYNYIELVSSSGNSNLQFYAYKYSSIMFDDSNFVGVFITALLFFSIYMNRNYNVDLKKQSYILFFLCLLSLSRANIIASIGGILLFKLAQNRFLRKNKYLYYFLFILIFLGSLNLGNYNLFQDRSLNQRFYALNEGLEMFNNLPVINRIIGIGLNNTPDYLGMSAHNYFLAYFLETGLLGVSLIIIFYLLCLKKLKTKFFWFIFPIIVSFQSFAPYAMPYLYLIVGIMLVLERHKQVNVL